MKSKRLLDFFNQGRGQRETNAHSCEAERSHRKQVTRRPTRHPKPSGATQGHQNGERSQLYPFFNANIICLGNQCFT